MEMQRYFFSAIGLSGEKSQLIIGEDPNGDWVRYADAQEQERVLREALEEITQADHIETARHIAAKALGKPCEHDFRCHNPGDQGDGCLCDDKGRLKHRCLYCGITRRAALAQ